MKRLLGLDDHRSAAIVRRIGQEEVAHVGVGVFHFLRICDKIGVDPGDEFKELLEECNVELHGPFNHKARELAGLRREWYDKSDPTDLSEVEQKPQRLGWKGRDRGGKEKRTQGASDSLNQPQESAKQFDEEPKGPLQSSLTEGNGGMPDKLKSESENSYYHRFMRDWLCLLPWRRKTLEVDSHNSEPSSMEWPEVLEADLAVNLKWRASGTSFPIQVLTSYLHILHILQNGSAILSIASESYSSDSVWW